MSTNTMKGFYEFEYGNLTEKLITFAGKAYPKFGNVIIMAGGAGSGKGFVKDKLVGAEGYTFDVDELKKLSAKTPAIIKKVKDELGVDLAKIGRDMKNPDNVAKMHEIIGDYLNLDDKRMQTFYASIMTKDPSRKPNIIFDVTLKDLRKLQNITNQVKSLGYNKNMIHIVWVVNDIEVAIKQNAARDRSVPVEILINTHRGAAQTMGDIINMGRGLSKYMDGDIVFAFNKVGVDSDLAVSGRGGSYIKDSNYFYIKRSGKPILPMEAISRDVRAKIKDYVPKGVDWD